MFQLKPLLFILLTNIHDITITQNCKHCEKYTRAVELTASSFYKSKSLKIFCLSSTFYSPWCQVLKFHRKIISSTSVFNFVNKDVECLVLEQTKTT